MSLTRILLLSFLVIEIKGLCLPEEKNITTCCKCQRDSPKFHCLGHCHHEAVDTDVICQLSKFDNSTRTPGETSMDFLPTTSSSPTTKEESGGSGQADQAISVPRGGVVSGVSCVRCDAACDGCEGPGPHNCYHCAQGYQRRKTTSESGSVLKCSLVRVSEKTSETNIAVGVSLATVGVVSIIVVSVAVRYHCTKSKGRDKQQCDQNDSSDDREEAGNRSSTSSENPGTDPKWSTHKTNFYPETTCCTNVNENSNNVEFVLPGAVSSPCQSLPSDRQSEAPAAIFSHRENKITTHITAYYLNNCQDDTDSVQSSRPISIASSGYISAGDGFGSLPSVTDKDLLHGVGRSFSVLPGSTQLMKSSSTQTLSSLDSIPLPFIHTCWQYKKEISVNGGFVQKDHSDVRLEVPQGAIERGDDVMIHKAVSVNLQSACAKLPVPENEVIVSPVAEFYAGEGFRFRKPVCIVLPHLLPVGVTERDIHVYQFSCDESGQPQLEELQYGSSDHPQASNPVTAGSVGTYCFGEGSTVHIFVNHFSGVLCTKCKSDCYLPDLWLELYGHYSHISEMKAEVELVLKIWDTDIADFKQDDLDNDSLNLSKMKKIDGKSLPAVEMCGDSDQMREVESTDLSVRLALPSHELPEWMHETRDDGQHGEHHAYPPEESFRLKQFVVCDKHKAKRYQRKDWSLVNKTGVTPGGVFTCLVDAGYVRTDGAHADNLRHYIQSPRKITFKVTLSPDTLGHNAGDNASGVAKKESYRGSRGQGHDGPSVASHETQRKFAAGDPDETSRKRVCQAEAYQRAPVSFGSTKTVNIVVQTPSHEGTGYSNTQSPPSREHLGDESLVHVSPSTGPSLSTPSPGHHGPVSSAAREQSSSENTQTSPNDSSAATGNGSHRLTLTGLPCEPDSSSLLSSTMSSVV